MELEAVQVQNYKCFFDSGAVDIQPGVTCLVGKNESGKTAFLEALYRLNPAPTGYKEDFDALIDYPRRLFPKEKQDAPEFAPIEATFRLEEQEADSLNEEYGFDVLQSKEIVVQKRYSNERNVEFEMDEEAAVNHLLSEHDVDTDLSGDYDFLDELIDGIDNSETTGNELNSLRSEAANLTQQVSDSLEARIPKFIYFDQYSTLPGRFSIERIQNQAESNLDSDERTALSLLRFAGVEEGEFTQAQYEARKAALEAAAIEITEEVFNYWSQNQDLKVEFDRVTDQQANAAGNPPYLEVRIYNEQNMMSLNFDERSSGFVWFFSFLCFFSEYESEDENVILLLDEPGLNLHASAQRDLLDFIDERLAPSNQLLYTTHSPFMIEASDLQRARTVEVQGDRGAKVSGDMLSVSRDTVFPLQAALGYDLSQTLYISPDNLIVEGPSDIIYLNIVSDYLEEIDREGLNERWSIVPAGGISKIPTFISLLGTQLNIAVVMDASTGGHQKIDDLVKKDLIGSDRLFPITEITGGNEADIEDLFTNGFYLKLVDGAGVASLKVSDLKEHTRIVKRIERTIDSSFDHYRPASYFLNNQSSLLERMSDATLDRFEKLFAGVNSCLS
jgi:predicted ATP-dependent endonuclease of OLD family